MKKAERSLRSRSVKPLAIGERYASRYSSATALRYRVSLSRGAPRNAIL